MPYYGGLRARLIHESLFNYLREALDDLGWFDPGRPHLPINYISVPVEVDENITLNTLSLSSEDVVNIGGEMGTPLAEYRWSYFVDFFAEKEDIGLHLIRDLRDILGGRFSTIGITQDVFPVYDITLATPPIIFYCQLENIETDKGFRDLAKGKKAFWHSVAFDVIDTYGWDG